MRQKLVNVGNVLHTPLVALLILLLMKDCESDRENRVVEMESVKANEYNKGFTEGYNAAMNGMEFEETKTDKP